MPSWMVPRSEMAVIGFTATALRRQNASKATTISAPPSRTARERQPVAACVLPHGDRQIADNRSDRSTRCMAYMVSTVSLLRRVPWEASICPSEYQIVVLAVVLDCLYDAAPRRLVHRGEGRVALIKVVVSAMSTRKGTPPR